MKPAIALLILGLAMMPPLAPAQDLASLEKMRTAAEQGDTDAQLELGILYEFGFNLPKNHVNALAWYLRAAEQGNEFAAKRRDRIQSGMNAEEVEAARKLARELAVKAPASANPSPAPPAPAEAPLAGPPNLDAPAATP